MLKIIRSWMNRPDAADVLILRYVKIAELKRQKFETGWLMSDKCGLLSPIDFGNSFYAQLTSLARRDFLYWDSYGRCQLTVAGHDAAGVSRK